VQLKRTFEKLAVHIFHLPAAFMTTQVKNLKKQFEGLADGFTMSSTGQKKSYGPPTIPKTPSRTINNMLQTRCNKTYENPGKAAIAMYICGVFTIITKLYDIINPDKNKHSHTMWMVSCGVVTFLIIVKSYLIYNIVVGLAFLFHNLLYYGALGLALFGAGLGVSGMVFFDKDGDGNQTTFNAGVGNFRANVTTDFSKSQ
jgi:hypothetical protein